MRQTRVTQDSNLPQAAGELLANLSSLGSELIAITNKYGITLMAAIEIDITARSPFKNSLCKGGLRVVARPGFAQISSNGGANMKVEELKPGEKKT